MSLYEFRIKKEIFLSLKYILKSVEVRDKNHNFKKILQRSIY